MKTKRYIIKAPFFSGFYESGLFDDLDDLSGIESNHPELYEELEKRELVREFGEELSALVDWKKTHEEIARRLVDNVYADFFNEYVESVKFSHLFSPKYYNYHTDEIYVDIEISDEQIMDIERYCFFDNSTDFKNFLDKNYSSRSGFISFIETNLYSFQSAYKHESIHGEGNLVTYLGIMFRFIFFKVRVEAADYDDFVCPYDLECYHECLAWLECKSDEDIARQIIEEHDEN